jgi:hypothetical protein
MFAVAPITSAMFIIPRKQTDRPKRLTKWIAPVVSWITGWRLLVVLCSHKERVNVKTGLMGIQCELTAGVAVQGRDTQRAPEWGISQLGKLFSFHSLSFYLITYFLLSFSLLLFLSSFSSRSLFFFVHFIIFYFLFLSSTLWCVKRKWIENSEKHYNLRVRGWVNLYNLRFSQRWIWRVPSQKIELFASKQPCFESYQAIPLLPSDKDTLGCEVKRRREFEQGFRCVWSGFWSTT